MLSHLASSSSFAKTTRIDDLVGNLHDAYRRGRVLQRDDAADAGLHGWLEHQSRYLISRLSRQELGTFAQCKKACSSAREAAVHDGDMESACRFLATAQMLAEKVGLSTEAQLRCRTELAAAESHVDACCHDIERARMKVLEAMALDEELEKRFGYRLTHVHRIHLLNRLVTLSARGGDLPEAISLAASIFSYLEGCCEGVPVRGSWGSQYLAHLSTGILSFLTRQLTGEVAAILLRQDNEVVLNSLKLILQGRSVAAVRERWDPVARTWFDLKILSLEASESLKYVAGCTEFLAQGPGAAKLLWHLSALDAATICARLDDLRGSIFRRMVLKDLLAMPNFPLSLKAHWVKLLSH